MISESARERADSARFRAEPLITASECVPRNAAGAAGALVVGTVCILDLYRSAQPDAFAGWGPELSTPTRSRGLVLRATAGTFDDPVASAEVAARLVARTGRLEGLGHWWMLEDPAASAAVLRSSWASLDS
jgi:hypothetical protein